MRGLPYRGNIEASTINTKPSVLDYRREQVAVKHKEKVREVGRKVADGCRVVHKEREKNTDSEEREMQLWYNLQRLISISHRTAAPTKHEQRTKMS